jgi:hypothetical protein
MLVQTPSFQDEVTHKLSGVTGTVIATYTSGGVAYLDVRSASYDRIFYKSPAENWTVVRTKEEVEGTTD